MPWHGPGMAPVGRPWPTLPNRWSCSSQRRRFRVWALLWTASRMTFLCLLSAYVLGAQHAPQVYNLSQCLGAHVPQVALVTKKAAQGGQPAGSAGSPRLAAAQTSPSPGQPASRSASQPRLSAGHWRVVMLRSGTVGWGMWSQCGREYPPHTWPQGWHASGAHCVGPPFQEKRHDGEVAFNCWNVMMSP